MPLYYMESSFKIYKTPWFSFNGKYQRNTPLYYNNNDFEWAQTIEDNFSKIKPEIEAFLKSQGQSFDPYFNTDLVGNNHSWKIGGFYFWGKKIEDNCKYIPKLEKILTAIPGFVSAGISVMEPHTDIKIHHGDTDASVRAHLGLSIPEKLPICGMEVGNIQKSWENGKIFIFCDAQLHRAWNHSNKTRYILIIDIIKPEFLSIQKSVCANALSLIFLQQLEYKYPFIKKTPGFLRGLIRIVLKYIK
jgi:ornithine lipid ester-linked acyl 2-hydroxylase